MNLNLIIKPCWVYAVRRPLADGEHRAGGGRLLPHGPPIAAGLPVEGVVADKV
ncbi:MAG TPA: hypothetical protein PKL16_09040 [Anaerolineae bacterium]|nr:MAG: hypothetical protein BWY25_00750 [Chloroflexi bacterium ADurb.Bin222]HOC21632.1 hypothetical protein [Anaerolineae bacterium]HQM15147.1 hypothetical protein [Anaerolineae bacterium]